MKKIYLVVASVLSFTIALAQPANDNCATAQAIGSLPTPAACPSGAGANVVVPGTLNAATAANPYTYQGTGCTGSSTTMASPAIDVWYTFVATGYQLNLTIAGTVANPNVAVYAGTCASLGGGVGGCSVGTAGGNGSLVVQQMVIGNTYHIQVSGNSAAATGTFTLTLNNSISCTDCLGATNLTVNPAPTNGMYAPNTTVNFCFKINSYTQVNTNWLHGVQLAFGAGWNLASLTTTPPPNCETAPAGGTWAYFPAGITDNSGQAWPAGFYFDTPDAGANPGDNFGDNCSGNISAANWNFCFSITTKAACTPGSDLSATINTSGDGESGSWSSLGCANDPATVFHAIGSCCPPTMSSVPVSCFGGSDGTATATPVGAMGPYNYSWTNSGGTVVSSTNGVAGANTATGLPIGTYTVSITDKNNCVATNTVTITGPTAVTLTLTPTNPTCGSNNGSISATGGGGTPGYTYNIDGGGFAAASNFPGLAAGTHTVIVHDSKGCADTATATLVTTGSTTVTANPATICNGASTILTGTGATTYTWSANAGSATTATVSVNPTVNTTYTVTGNNGGCIGTATLLVTVNPLPTVNVTPGTVCNGASAPLTASGASTYTWSPPTGLSATTGANVNANPATTTSYTVTGTDVNGCVDTGTTTVTVISNPTVTVNSAAICLGQQTATLTANGATTYAWSPPTGLSATVGTTVTANPATTTTYTIVGTAGTCTATTTAVVTVNPIPVVTVNTGTICLGQTTANLNAGGAATYSWTPATGLSATNVASVVANPAATTSYTVTGISASGCTNTATTSVLVNPTPTVNVTLGTVCNGASAPLTASGASTYTWSPATGLSATTGANVNANPATTTAYTINATDANGCTGIGTTTVTVISNPTVTVNSAAICLGQQTATLTANGATTYAWSPATGLSATTGSVVIANPAATTTYTIVGTAGTCTATATSVVTVNSIPVVTVNTGTICIGQQTANLNAAGATIYTWTPSTGLSATNIPNVVASPGVTTSYTVGGMDGNGCVNSATTTVTVNPLPPVSVSGALICSGGSTPLTATGAISYTWTPAGGLSSTNGSPVNANPASTTIYSVTGTDGNGCTNTDSATVTVVSNPTITVTTSTICLGQQTATLTANGATTYTWSPAGSLSSANGNTVTATPATTTNYSVIGTVGTCTAIGTTTVTVNTIPIITVNTGTICIGQQTATLSAGGAATYSWIPGTGLNATNVPTVLANPNTTTAYTVAATDANGCFSANTTTVTVNPLPTIVVSSTLICNGNSATLPANGGVTYTWTPATGLSSTNGSPVNANPITTTIYSVTGTDANGCFNTDSATVTVQNNPIITANTSTICAGQQTATLTANGAGTYVWNPSATLSSPVGTTVTGAPATTTGYTITGTVGTCTATGTTTITVNALPIITIGSNSPVCVNQTLNLTGSGALTYTWSGPNSFASTAPNPSIPGVTAAANGIYTLSVTDANTCTNVATENVVINSLPIVTATGATVCLNNTINLSAGGGVLYSWGGPNGYASNIQNPPIPNADATMAGTYVVTVTDGNGCVNANVAQVVVNNLPVVGANSATICLGQQIATLTANGANTYVWGPAAGLNTTTGTSVNASPVTTTIYTVTGTDLNNCQDADTLVVTVNPLPAVVISPQNMTGCAPVCVSYSNTIAAVNGTCSWSFGNGNTSTSCTPSNCFSSQGTFSISLTQTDGNGCVNFGSATVTVYPVPHADFGASPQPTTILDNTINFVDLSTGAVINTWNWSLGTGVLSTVQNPAHLYGDTGTYAISLLVISDHGCRDSVLKYIKIDDDYSLYVPNAFSPNGDGVNDIFYAKGEGIKDFRMFIFDRWGNQVFFSDDIYKGWDGRFQSRGEQIVQEDVYVWKIQCKTNKGEKKQLAGHVSLLK
jgi:gliding motility-associated-like protein